MRKLNLLKEFIQNETTHNQTSLEDFKARYSKEEIDYIVSLLERRKMHYSKEVDVFTEKTKTVKKVFLKESSFHEIISAISDNIVLRYN